MTFILSQYKLLKQSFIMRRSVRVGDTTYMLYYSGVQFTLLPFGVVLCTHRYGLYIRCTLNGVRIIDVLGENTTRGKKWSVVRRKTGSEHVGGALYVEYTDTYAKVVHPIQTIKILSLNQPRLATPLYRLQGNSEDSLDLTQEKG